MKKLKNNGLLVFVQVRGIVAGLRYLHSNGIVHADLKAVRRFDNNAVLSINGIYSG